MVLIQVEAAGVHLVDTMIRAGTTGGSPIPVPELPTIPGREVSGRVTAVGPGVDPSWIGKRVVVHLGMVPGGYAELAVAKVESLYELPDHVDAAQAVAAIGTGRTTAGILNQAKLSADDVVLVTAAAGGIGSYLVQAGAERRCDGDRFGRRRRQGRVGPVAGCAVRDRLHGSRVGACLEGRAGRSGHHRPARRGRWRERPAGLRAARGRWAGADVRLVRWWVDRVHARGSDGPRPHRRLGARRED